MIRDPRSGALGKGEVGHFKTVNKRGGINARQVDLISGLTLHRCHAVQVRHTKWKPLASAS
jgi:hypothetical protein